ncbi:hypothetical protein HDU67_001879 [Dinochytrium kinnereticum]|nr:hypothetical protein HDU67_001879 [Dinochytrium kinnereticum]
MAELRKVKCFVHFAREETAVDPASKIRINQLGSNQFTLKFKDAEEGRKVEVDGCQFGNPSSSFQDSLIEGIVNGAFSGLRTGVFTTNIGRRPMAQNQKTRTSMFVKIAEQVIEMASTREEAPTISFGYFGITDAKVVNLKTEKKISNFDEGLDAFLNEVTCLDDVKSSLAQDCSLPVMAVFKISLGSVKLPGYVYLVDIGSVTFDLKSKYLTSGLSNTIQLLRRIAGQITNPAFEGIVPLRESPLTSLCSEFLVGDGRPSFVFTVDQNEDLPEKDIDLENNIVIRRLIEENEALKENFNSLKIISDACTSDLAEASERIQDLEDELSSERLQFKDDVKILKNSHSIHVQQMVDTLQKEIATVVEDGKIIERTLKDDIVALDNRRLLEASSLEAGRLKEEEQLVLLKDEIRKSEIALVSAEYDLDRSHEYTNKLNSVISCIESDFTKANENTLEVTIDIESLRLWQGSARKFISKLLTAADYCRSEVEKAKVVAHNIALAARSEINSISEGNSLLLEELSRAKLAHTEAIHGFELVSELKSKLERELTLAEEKSNSLAEQLAAKEVDFKTLLKSSDAEKVKLKEAHELEISEMQKKFESEKMEMKKKYECDKKALLRQFEDDLQTKILEAKEEVESTRGKTASTLDKLKSRYEKDLQEKVSEINLKYELMESKLAAKEKERLRLQVVLDAKTKYLEESERGLEFERELWNDDRQKLRKKIESLEARLASAIKASALDYQSDLSPSEPAPRKKGKQTKIQAPSPMKKLAPKATAPSPIKKTAPKKPEKVPVASLAKPPKKQKDGEFPQHVSEEEPEVTQSKESKLSQNPLNSNEKKDKPVGTKRKKVEVEAENDLQSESEMEIIQAKKFSGKAPRKKSVESSTKEDLEHTTKNANKTKLTAQAKKTRTAESTEGFREDEADSDSPTKEANTKPKKRQKKEAVIASQEIGKSTVGLTTPGRPTRERRQMVTEWWKVQPKIGEERPLTPKLDGVKLKKQALGKASKYSENNRSDSDNSIHTEPHLETEESEEEREVPLTLKRKSKIATVEEPPKTDEISAKPVEPPHSAEVAEETIVLKPLRVAKEPVTHKPAKLPLADLNRQTNKAATVKEKKRGLETVTGEDSVKDVKDSKKKAKRLDEVAQENIVEDSGDETRKIKRRLSEKKATNDTVESFESPSVSEPQNITFSFSKTVALPTTFGSASVGTVPDPSIANPFDKKPIASRHSQKRLQAILAGASQS